MGDASGRSFPDVKMTLIPLSLSVLASTLSCGSSPKLAEVEERVWTPSCNFSSCHVGASPAEMLSLNLSTGPTGAWVPMPKTGFPMNEERVELVRDWIDGGAEQ